MTFPAAVVLGFGFALGIFGAVGFVACIAIALFGWHRPQFWRRDNED